jgi:hypothetical protein
MAKNNSDMNLYPHQSPGYPFPKLKIKVDQTFVGRVVQKLGGEPFDGSRTFPEGVKPVDFLIGGYALEYKELDEDPLVSHSNDRPAKIAGFVSEKIATGELSINGTGVHMTGSVGQEYRLRFLGVSIGRHFETAAKQIRSTRAFLKSPSMKGAVFIVNRSAPFIDADSFANLVQSQQRRADFADAINLAIYFSVIPGILDGRFVVAAGYAPGKGRHIGFAERFLATFRSTVAESLGKSELERIVHEKPIQPIRFPVRFDGGTGNSVTFR